MARNTKRRRRRHLLRIAVKTAFATFLLTTILLVGCGGFYIYKHQQNPLISKEVLASDLPKLEVEKSFTIIMDAGHGGKDPGTHYKDIEEKDINLEVATQLSYLLKNAGYNVIMTRTNDSFVELPDRAYISNSNDADLFISIHCNYNEDSTEISGLECHYYGSGAGETYADNIITVLNNTSNIQTRGSICSDFHVLRNTNAPAVLIELGYISNKTDRENLSDKAYQTNLSEVLASAIGRAITEE